MEKETSKYKYYVFLFLSLVLLITLSNLALAMNFINPANTTTVSGGRTGGRTVFNLTLLDGESVTGNFSCSLNVGSTITANTTWTRVNISDSVNALNVGNNTAGAGLTSGANRLINSSFDSTSLEDGNDYIFNATCVNDTGVIQSVTNRFITVENTAPSAPVTPIPATGSFQDSNDSLSFSATVTGRQTTACSLHFVEINPGATFYNMTHSGDTCTYLRAGTSENTYRWFVRATDGTNNTDSDIFTVNLDLADNARSTGVNPLTGKVESVIQSNVGGIPIGAIIGIALIVILIYFAFIKR